MSSSLIIAHEKCRVPSGERRDPWGIEPVTICSTSTMPSTSTTDTVLGVMSPCRSKLTQYRRPVSREICIVAGNRPSSASPTTRFVPASYL